MSKIDESSRVEMHATRNGTAPGAKRISRNRPIARHRVNLTGEPFDPSRVSRDPRLTAR